MEAIYTPEFLASEREASERQDRYERAVREEAAHAAWVHWAAEAHARGMTVDAYLGI